MKIMYPKYFLSALFAMFVVSAAFAAPEPPAPTSTTNRAALAAPPPTPPGFPVDENIVVLLVTGLLFGNYIIYKNRYQKKISV